MSKRSRVSSGGGVGLIETDKEERILGVINAVMSTSMPSFNTILFIFQQFPLKQVFRYHPQTLIRLKNVNKELNRYVEEQVRNDQYFWYDIFKYSFPDALISLNAYCATNLTEYVFHLSNENIVRDIGEDGVEVVYNTSISQFFLEYTQESGKYVDILETTDAYSKERIRELSNFMINRDILKGYAFSHLDRSFYDKKLLDICVRDEDYGKFVLKQFKLVSPCGVPPAQYCFTSQFMLRIYTIIFLFTVKQSKLNTEEDDQEEEDEYGPRNTLLYEVARNIILKHQIEFVDMEPYMSFLSIENTMKIREYIKKLEMTGEEGEEELSINGNGPYDKRLLSTDEKKMMDRKPVLHKFRLVEVESTPYSLESLIESIISFIEYTYEYEHDEAEGDEEKKQRAINVRLDMYKLLMETLTSYLVFDNHGKMLYQHKTTNRWMLASEGDGSDDISGVFLGSLFDNEDVDKDDVNEFIESINFQSMLKKQEENLYLFGTLDPLYWEFFLLDRTDEGVSHARIGLESFGNNEYWLNLMKQQITWIKRYGEKYDILQIKSSSCSLCGNEDINRLSIQQGEPYHLFCNDACQDHYIQKKMNQLVMSE